MKTTSTFSIHFWANFSRVKDGQTLLYARITVNGKRATLGLKQKVAVADWDIHKNRMRGTNPQARLVNSYLDEVYSSLFSCYQSLKLTHKVITAQAIKSKYLGSPQDAKTLSDIINYHNEDKAGKLKWGTKKNYFTTQKTYLDFF